MSTKAPGIIAPDGRAARRALPDDRCPTCRAPKTDRIKGGGFGDLVVVCGKCGFEFPEGTRLDEGDDS